ncbi:hypothetical protein PISMIDRAFT_682928 [Pisolithus microcarpus 441]|uniref:Uncharacterized protein n=1 Tax=Pisolithus microcarpus 441 TaxID=765257 RepID=A0A0C9ZHZ1_9AGAM|nr:hypothetical protein PISMIDRAFT_682928 [Pisolithus microcarpus 441]
MSRRGQAFIVHALSAFVMARALLYTHQGPIASKISQQPKGIIVLYLTIQGLAGSCACMVLGLIQDMFPGTRRYLHPLKRALTMVFLPMDFVVSSVYWSLRTFAPSLILLPTETSSTSSSLPIRIAIYVGASCVGLGCLVFLNRMHSASR